MTTEVYIKVENMEISTYKKLGYVTRYPENFDENKKYPLVFYIHGAGGRGKDISLISNHACFSDTEPYLKNALTVAPQCYADTWFDIFEQLIDFIESRIDLPYVEKERVYLVGASMGGYTTWQLAMSRPELFAGILPICGGGMYWNAARLKNTAVWAFHGEIDSVVKVEESRKMVEKINAAGGNARLTVYPDTDHNSWTPTLTNYEVFEWLLAQRNHYIEIRTEFNDTKTFG